MLDQPFTLPNRIIKTEDGGIYTPPDWVLKEFLPKLMDLPKDEYVRLCLWLGPSKFYFTAISAAQNPLLSQLFEHMVMEDRYAYLSRYTPPPGVRKQ